MKVWVLMKIIVAQYHQLTEPHHKTSLQDQHQCQTEDEQILNSSDPTHNRGKVNRVNSINTTQEWVAATLKNSKGGPFKTSGMKSQPQPSSSNQVESHRPQLNCTACGGCNHLRKDCHKDVFAVIAE